MGKIWGLDREIMDWRLTATSHSWDSYQAARLLSYNSAVVTGKEQSKYSWLKTATAPTWGSSWSVCTGAEPSFHPSRAIGLENSWSLTHLAWDFSFYGTNKYSSSATLLPFPEGQVVSKEYNYYEGVLLGARGREKKAKKKRVLSWFRQG